MDEAKGSNSRLQARWFHISILCLCVLLAGSTLARAQAPYRICVVGIDTTGQPVLPPAVIHAASGGFVRVGVWIDPAGGSTEGIKSFDLLLCYDANVLSRLTVLRGSGLASDWEFFSYRFESAGQIRLIGSADLPGGPTPGDAAFDPRGMIAGMGFYVTADAAQVGTCTDLSFCAFACGDNVLTSRYGDTSYVPTGVGVVIGPGYDPGHCKVGTGGGREARIDFCPAQLCIDSSYIGCGDVNLNGIRGEIADIILFARYFIYGPSVFEPFVPFPFPWEQLDCDGDGHVGVSDLVMMIRMYLIGMPISPGGSLKPSAQPATADLSWQISDGALKIQTTSNLPIGGMLLTYRYDGFDLGVAAPAVESQMQVRSASARGLYRILIHPDPNEAGGMIPAGSNVIATVPVKGNGTLELVGQEACDYYGFPMTLRVSAALPQGFALLPNYPNPFNAGTVIPFQLNGESDWTLTIYNVAGQTIRTFEGHGAGRTQIEWDGTTSAGTPLASGIYFCRLVADQNYSTR
ncbi:MAG: T9SS type A sorting domain-containing protein, partial [candidate division Zixibacteria bacterium]|nr:T9SS type A sorting domain-containing protein [candidate division Zixibacteria bacterium]